MGHADIGREIGWNRKRVESWIRRNITKTHRRSDGQTPSSVTLKADGSQISCRILALTEEQRTDPDEHMRAHGYDPLRWEVVTAVSNLWHQQTEGGGTVPLYQSKLTVRPRTSAWPEIIEQIKHNTVPLEVEPEYVEDAERHLLIACNDLHFGAVSYEQYIDSQQRIIDLLVNGYSDAVIYLAGDLLDTDNLRGTTAHGTHVGKIDMPQAWADLCAYIEPIVSASLKYSKRTQVILLRGNHSESMEWAFAQYLAVRYPQAEVDSTLDYAKAIMLGQTFVGLTHGYKNAHNAVIDLSKRFAPLWGAAKHRELITAHRHKESTDHGALVRVLPTRAPRNEWAAEQGYIEAHAAFQCFEYSSDDIAAIYYV